MSTNYPNGYDSFTDPHSTDGLGTVSHSTQHTNANDALKAIETELGVTPQGIDSDLAARLARIDVSDATPGAHMHTLGPGPLQAAAGTHQHKLASLQNVNITNLQDGDILIYDSASSMWVNHTWP